MNLNGFHGAFVFTKDLCRTNYKIFTAYLEKQKRLRYSSSKINCNGR